MFNKKIKIILCLLALLMIGLLIFLLSDSKEEIKVKLVNIDSSAQTDSEDISTSGMTFIFRYSQIADADNDNPRFKIVSVEAVGDKTDIQFGGNITCWFREPNKLEYVINGDIYLKKNIKAEIRNIADENQFSCIYILDGKNLKSKQYVYIHETKELEVEER